MISTPGSTPARAGDLYADLIQEHLERQAERKASIEQRGLAVISTAGGLVTLQFALAAVVVDRDGFQFADLERIALGVSLLLFVTASVLGLLTNSTRSYTYVSTRQLKALTEPGLWNDSQDDARRRIARARVSMLRTAREHNKVKAALLRSAIVSEVAAVAALAVCVALILLRDSQV